MGHRWLIVDLVQLAQTIWGGQLVAIIHRQELSHFGIICLSPVIGDWRAKFIIRAFNKVGQIIRKVMTKMDSWFDEVNVLADIVRHCVGVAAYHTSKSGTTCEDSR